MLAYMGIWGSPLALQNKIREKGRQEGERRTDGGRQRVSERERERESKFSALDCDARQQPKSIQAPH